MPLLGSFGADSARGFGLNTGKHYAKLVVNATGFTTTLYGGSTSGGQVSVTGGAGPYIYGVATGSLPNGLTINSSTGVISGVVIASGSPTSFTVTFGVTDSSTHQSATSTPVTFNVAAQLTISTSSLVTTLTSGTTSAGTLTATGGSNSYTYTIVSGTLPTGMNLGSSTGAITGTVTQSYVPVTSTATFRVTDNTTAATSNSSPVTFTVSPTILSINTSAVNVTANTTLISGSSMTGRVTASGGSGNYTYTVSGTLPSGISLTSSGTFSGTVTAPATITSYPVTFTVTDTTTNNTATSSTVTFKAYPGVTLTNNLGTTALTRQTAYNGSVAGAGGTGTYTYAIYSSTGTSLTNMGLSFSTSTGALTGTATNNTTSSVSNTTTFSVTDGLGQTALSSAISFSVTSLTAMSVTGSMSSSYGNGNPGNGSFSVTGGQSPYVWAEGDTGGVALSTLGLTLSAGSSPYSTLTISGTATNTTTSSKTATGVYFTATDIYGNYAASVVTTVTVSGYPALVITPNSIKTSYNNGDAASGSFSATGGTGSGYTWAEVDGGGVALSTLGLGLNSSGALTGTAANTGTSTISANNISFKVTDSAGNSLTYATSYNFSVTGVFPVPSGGTIVNPGDGYIYRVFTVGSVSTNFSLSGNSLLAEVLVVGPGGGGGAGYRPGTSGTVTASGRGGGGGGAGGIGYKKYILNTGNFYIVVGSGTTGGQPASSGSGAGTPGATGSSSSFVEINTGITVYGQAGGGGAPAGQSGNDGGCGGGGGGVVAYSSSADTGGNANQPGSTQGYTAFYGQHGGANLGPAGGGGGGTGAVGTVGIDTNSSNGYNANVQGGDGGTGTNAFQSWYYTNTLTLGIVAGGGGGGGYVNGIGGTGGGGRGGYIGSAGGASATYYGSGGGGGTTGSSGGGNTGGAGYQGIVIIRYLSTATNGV